MSLSTYYEEVDPMVATNELVTTDHLFAKWSSNLPNPTAWNWKEMKNRLANKAANEKWYIVKSVDTMPSEDGQAPFVPNFICFKVKKNVHEFEQAPRLQMKSIVHDDTMDIEAFSANDIVDMKGEFHWRPLEKHSDIFILCKVNEDTTSETKAFDFSACSAGFGSTTAATTASFSFGDATAATPTANAFSFGAGTTSAAPAANAFSFGSGASAVPVVEKTSRKRKADDALPVEQPQKKQKDNEGEARAFIQNDEDEATFPVLFQTTEGCDTIGDMKEELESGMKIKAEYVAPDGKFKQKLIVEQDIEFAELDEAEQKQWVEECVEKRVLATSAQYAELKEKYEGAGVQYTNEDDHEKRQAAFVVEKKAILQLPDVRKTVTDIMSEHGDDMHAYLKGVADGRVRKMKASLAQLQTIQDDIDAGKMQTREHTTVMRVFPETDSIASYCAFRPASSINKSVGRADDTYPPAYRMVNGLTGHVTIA